MEKRECLIKEAKVLLDTKPQEYKDEEKEVKRYSHELYTKLEEEEIKLYEEKRKLDDKINELRSLSSDVFSYYLSIK